ncbi:MAG: triphosphoribosyl-dephospho-CoA synthase CitG [Limosilactobacillus oris]
MTSIFATGQPQDIPAVLANKDRRAALQQRLVAAHPAMTVVAAKLNIPGPIKNNRAIQRFFTTELLALERDWLTTGQLFYQDTEWLDAGTGPERFYLVKATPQDVKAQTTRFEEGQASHRLFDLDVLVQRAGQVVPLSRADSGQPARRCFVCGRPAKECGRSRRHTVAELQAAVSSLISAVLAAEQRRRVRDRLVAFAQQSLLYEVVAWPKPGLVDPVEHGAHPDMSVFTFINSSLSFRRYLEQAAELGLSEHPADYPLMFKELRELGKRAEQAMFAATNGVNTHKGAVFSLGIMTLAVADSWRRNGRVDLADIQATVKQLLVGLVQDDLQKQAATDQQTAGELQYHQYGLTGIRGEAQAGYPTVFDHGLPTMLATAGEWNRRIIQTMLALARYTEDSTLVKRAGDPAILEWKNAQVDACLAAGGITTAAGRGKLAQLEQEFTAKHLSLGGTADLLIVTIFLTLVKERLADGLSNE